MSEEKSISIIVPCLNEEHNLEKALLELKDEFSTYSFNWEVLVIDDGSVDETCTIGEEFSKKFSNFSIIKNNINLGLAKTFYKGIRLAKNDYVVFFPGDNEISARSLRLNADRIGGADILISYPENSGKRALPRAVISKLFVFIVNVILNKGIKYYNGSNIYKRTDVISTKMLSNSFAYQVLILAQLFDMGKTFEESTFILNYTSKRNNPINLNNLYNVTLDLLKVIAIRASGKV